MSNAPTVSPSWTEAITNGPFTGKTVVITGAGSGIGQSTASRVAREGGRVIAVNVSEQRLDELAQSRRDLNVVPVHGDITNDDDIAAILEASVTRSTRWPTWPESWTT